MEASTARYLATPISRIDFPGTTEPVARSTAITVHSRHFSRDDGTLGGRNWSRLFILDIDCRELFDPCRRGLACWHWIAGIFVIR